MIKFANNAVARPTESVDAISTVIPYTMLRGTWSVLVSKLDLDGNRIWDSTVGGTKIEYAYSLSVTENAIYVAGSTNSEPSAGWLVIKLDLGGSLVWSKYIGPMSGGVAQSIQATSDALYIVGDANVGGGAGAADWLIVKLDLDGNRIWNRLAGTTSADIAYDIQVHNDELVVVGLTRPSVGVGLGNDDITLVKFDLYGNRIWDKVLGGSTIDTGRAVKVTNNAMLIAGHSTSPPSAGLADAVVFRLDLDVPNGAFVADSRIKIKDANLAYSLPTGLTYKDTIVTHTTPVFTYTTPTLTYLTTPTLTYNKLLWVL